MKEKEITVLLPIHKWDEEYELMFMNALNSVQPFYNDVDLTIICPPNVSNKIIDLKLETKLNILTLPNKGLTDFPTQINFGIKNCKTKWFSILEIDDEYKPNWLKVMNQYISKNENVDVFLPVVEDINVNGDFLSYTNESVWAYGFSEVQGLLDNEVLLDFQNYQTSGGLYKTELFKDDLFLKDNIKLTFTYELLLRLTHNNIKVMVIPKVLYSHVNFREDSLFWSYKNGDNKLSEKEVKFWLDSAKHEFFFKLKRDLIFNE